MRCSDSLNSTLSSGPVPRMNISKERDRGRVQDNLPIPLAKSKIKAGPDKSSQDFNQKLIHKGSEIASWLNAECLSTTKEKFSVSKGQSSLRFTCQNGHNFFLPLHQVNELHSYLSVKSYSENSSSICISQDVLQNIVWCTKCRDFYKKTKEVC